MYGPCVIMSILKHISTVPQAAPSATVSLPFCFHLCLSLSLSSIRSISTLIFLPLLHFFQDAFLSLTHFFFNLRVRQDSWFLENGGGSTRNCDELKVLCCCSCQRVCVLVGVRGWGSVTRLAASTELRVSARHVSRETGAHLQSPWVQKGNLFTVCG